MERKETGFVFLECVDTAGYDTIKILCIGREGEANTSKLANAIILPFNFLGSHHHHKSKHKQSTMYHS